VFFPFTYDARGSGASDRPSSDWPGLARFFMQACFTEPGSAALIDELVEIALDASPEALITQKRELDWEFAPTLRPKVTCPTLFIHGDSDIT
jgi:pimeloyl-ACP methyl ester carboxylesterase